MNKFFEKDSRNNIKLGKLNQQIFFYAKTSRYKGITFQSQRFNLKDVLFPFFSALFFHVDAQGLLAAFVRAPAAIRMPEMCAYTLDRGILRFENGLLPAV